jgi:iron complex transport system ATP-binding protein
MKALLTVALTAYNITVMHDEFTVVDDVSLTLHAGEWVSLVGPNGAGKSSLLKAVAGLAPAEGQVILLGKPWAEWKRRERAQTLAWMGQAEAGQDDLTVYDVAMLGRLPHQSWLSTPSAKDHAVVEVALKTVQAWDWRTRSLGQLSGGERQRVLLARALAVEAQVLLMDEPLANLDPPHQADWLLMVRALVAEGKTVVSVLHEISLALQADEMLVMQQGRLAHQGDCSDAETHRALEQVFDARIAVACLAGQWLAVPRL